MVVRDSQGHQLGKIAKCLRAGRESNQAEVSAEVDKSSDV